MNLSQFLKVNKFEKFQYPSTTIKVGKEEKLITGGNSFNNKNRHQGFVYLFVIETDKPLLIIYIGKTIGTLRERMKDHERGSLDNNKGKANAECIISLMQRKRKDGFMIYGYGRHSKKIQIFNTEVSLCEAEEIAFKNVFSQNYCNELLLNDKRSTQLIERKKEWIKAIDVKLNENFTYTLEKEMYKSNLPSE